MSKEGSVVTEMPKRRLEQIVESLLVFLFFFAPLGRAGVNIIIPFLTIFWVATKIKYRECYSEIVRFPEIVKWVGVLGVGILLSFINAVNYSAAVKNFVDEYILFALVFIISLDVIKSQKLLRKLFLAAVASSAIVIVWSFYQRFIEGYDRINSTITGANETGIYFVCLVLLGISLLLLEKGLNRPKLAGVSLFTLLSLTCLIYTGSRGAWLSLFAGFIVLLFLAVKNRLFTYKKAIVLLLIFILVAFFVDFGWVFNRLESITDLSNSSNSQRILMALTGLRMLKAHPLFGVGIGQYQHVYGNYEIEEALFEETLTSYTHIHCLYVHLAAEIGLVGLFILAFLVYKILNTGFTTSLDAVDDQWFYYGIIGVFVALSVHNLFEWSLLNLQIGTFTLILVAIWLNKISISKLPQ